MAGLCSFELRTWLKVLFSPLCFLIYYCIYKGQSCLFSALAFLWLQIPTCPIWCDNTASPVTPQSASASCSLLQCLQCRNSWGSCAQQTCEVSPGLSMSSGHYSVSVFFGNFCTAPAFSHLLPSLASEAEWQEPGQSSGSWHNLYTQVSFHACFQLVGLLMIANTWVTCPCVHELGFCKLLILFGFISLAFWVISLL